MVLVLVQFGCVDFDFGVGVVEIDEVLQFFFQVFQVVVWIGVVVVGVDWYVLWIVFCQFQVLCQEVMQWQVGGFGCGILQCYVQGVYCDVVFVVVVGFFVVYYQVLGL